MIPMECPTCGRVGEVPLDRLNCKLTCKKCGTVFHMDDTGHIMLGEPGKASKKKVDIHLEPIDLNLGRMLKSIPKPVRYIGGAAAILVLGVLTAGKLIGSMGPPADLEGRANYLAEEFVDEDLEKIRQITLPETHQELTLWYDSVRPTLNFQGPRQADTDVMCGTQVWSQDNDGATTLTAVTVSAPSTPTPSAKGVTPKNDLTLEMVWTKQGGQWLMNAKGTLAASKRPQGNRGGGRGAARMGGRR